MTGNLPPGILLIVGACLLPLLPYRWRSAWLFLLPVLSAAHFFWMFPVGTEMSLVAFGYHVTPVHVDRLNLVWGTIFHLAGVMSVIYALHVKDTVQHVSALIYVGAAIGAVFAGDLISLFVYWELTAISSVFLIWSSRSRRSYRAGFRYLIFQVGSGVLLLAGILLHLSGGGSLAFTEAFHNQLPATTATLLGLNSPGTALIFLAFGIKAAFPLLNSWLVDAYSEATPTGTVFLSAFTTKLAIYALARGFPGTGLLLWIGVAMALYPLVYAAIENDLRRVLSYLLNNQLGFMIVGIGLANFAAHHEVAELAMNGTAAHAFVHILYKSLLLMSMGAVLQQAGTVKASELGGLYKSMPWTTAFCLWGGATIAVPLFGGFVSKSMILSAAAEDHQTAVWLILVFASAAVFHQAAVRLPYRAFFGPGGGLKVAEAPANMLLAMGLCALLCLVVGVVPSTLYGRLPYPVHYQPYTVGHVVTQLQLLLFATLAFVVMERTSLAPAERAAVNLDSDWILRKPGLRMVQLSYRAAGTIRSIALVPVIECITTLGESLQRWCAPAGPIGRSRSTGGMVIWAAILLGTYLILYYL